MICVGLKILSYQLQYLVAWCEEIDLNKFEKWYTLLILYRKTQRTVWENFHLFLIYYLNHLQVCVYPEQNIAADKYVSLCENVDSSFLSTLPVRENVMVKDICYVRAVQTTLFLSSFIVAVIQNALFLLISTC